MDRGGYHGLVDMLLRGNAPIDVRDQNGGTALHLASSNGHRNVVELLIAHNANIEAADYYGKRALHLASAKGHMEVLETLLRHNADVMARDNYGRTPLDMAERNDRVEVWKILRAQKSNSLQPGINPRRRTSSFGSFLSEAFPRPPNVFGFGTQKDKSGTGSHQGVEVKVRDNTKRTSETGKQDGQF
jgi:hypothetical protein